MKRTILIIGLCIILLSSFVTSDLLNASIDTHNRQVTPNTNYGSDTIDFLENKNTPANDRIYIGFNTTDINLINKINFSYYVSLAADTSASITVEFYFCSDGIWDESTMTWNNQDTQVPVATCDNIPFYTKVQNTYSAATRYIIETLPINNITDDSDGLWTIKIVNNPESLDVTNRYIALESRETVNPMYINYTTSIPSTQNLSVELLYPVNKTIFYGNYNGSIILNVSNSVNITTCSINNSIWDPITINNTPNVCYQEQSNVSTACGGLDTGNYSFSGVINNPTNAYDTDYNTFATMSLNGATSFIYYNYILPSNITLDTVWQVKDGLIKTNLSLSSCINFSKNNLNLRSRIHDSSAILPSFDEVWWECYNGADWDILLYSNGTKTVYEEAIFWKKGNESELIFNFINNTAIPDNNISLEYTCTDAFNTTSAEFWFYLETNLFITFYDEETDGILNIDNGEIVIIGEDLSTNITLTNQSTVNISLISGNYEIRYTADGYHRRIYYLTLGVGESADLNLYLINESTDISTQIIHTVFDQDGDRASNITVKLQRNYINNNVSVFKTVSMRRTNFQGEALFYVQLYDYFYKFIYETNDGTIIEITDPAPILTTTPIEQINLLGDPYLSLREYDNILFNLSYINDSGIEYFRFFYSDTTNLVREGCLNVQRITAKEYFDVCYTCVESTSATISCLINTSLDGQFKAIGLIDTDTVNSFYALDTLFYDDLSVIDYGQEGVFWSTIMIGSLVLMGLGSFTANILFLILGLVIMVISGFIVGFNIGFIYWIILLAFIVLFMITYSRKGK